MEPEKLAKLTKGAVVAETELDTTKLDKPVMRPVPLPPKRVGLRGALRGSVLWEGDIVSPIEGVWELSE